MIESFVDLTYRGLSLGRRIKLSQVRPSSGYLELASPMPVGTHVSIATDDGVTLDATVSWVHEQVAGSDRTPGMVVVPVLGAEPAAAWWTARVALPDEEAPRPRAARGRPVTVRPRSQTDRTPPPEDAITDEIPTMIADLNARVVAAAGVAQHPGTPGEAGVRPTIVMTALDQQALVQLTRGPDGEPEMRRTGDHEVIDDGRKTVIMAQIDPATFGLDPGGSGAERPARPSGAADAGTDGDPSAGEDGDDPEASEASEASDAEGGEGSDAGEVGGAGGAGEPGAAGHPGKPPGGRGKKRRRRR